MKATQKLDDSELLHLAIRASKENRHEDAIGLLKQALEIAPGNAKAHYMLGAEHAEIGMYDRAADEMAKATELDPSLVTAHFQLGLLHITSARVDHAQKAWEPLDELGAEHPLYLFKTGLLHLAHDEFDECVQMLEKGISLNNANEALNNDMRRILSDASARSTKGTSSDKATEAGAKPKAQYPKHVLLSAYRRNKDDKDKDTEDKD
jgi:tetratricopeptide (TPR) repeat protein